jgi:hypothetical protein
VTRRAVVSGSDYRPIDELLAMPKVRVLRILRRFEWASSTEITDALELDAAEVGLYSATISRLFKDGAIDRSGDRIYSYRYKVNAKGRTQLDRIIGRSAITDSMAVES